MINMICDNCGAEMDRNEKYCPDCGMELPGPRPKPSKKKYPKNSQGYSHNNSHSPKNYRNYSEEEDFGRKSLKKKNYRDSDDFNYDIPHPRANYRNYNEEEDYKRKPLKRKYYGTQSASAYYDSHEVGYESYYENEKDYKAKKSGSSLGTVLLLLVIVLLLGFIIGIIMFSSPQSIPQVPGINS